jgi:hypothetical protein
MQNELTVTLVGGALLTLSESTCGEDIAARVRIGPHGFMMVFADLTHCRMGGVSGDDATELWLDRAVFDMSSEEEAASAARWIAAVKASRRRA